MTARESIHKSKGGDEKLRKKERQAATLHGAAQRWRLEADFVGKL
jgi:hypothetical protein